MSPDHRSDFFVHDDPPHPSCDQGLGCREALLEHLEDRVQRYLVRYAPTPALFQRYLLRVARTWMNQKVGCIGEPEQARHYRQWQRWSWDRGEREQLIDDCVTTIFKSYQGVLDAEPYIRQRVVRLLERGYGVSHIHADLMSRGASRESVEQMIRMSCVDADGHALDPDQVAVRSYASRLRGRFTERDHRILRRRGIPLRAIQTVTGFVERSGDHGFDEPAEERLSQEDGGQ